MATFLSLFDSVPESSTFSRGHVICMLWRARGSEILGALFLEILIIIGPISENGLMALVDGLLSIVRDLQR